MPFDPSIPPGLEGCADAWRRLAMDHDSVAAAVAALDPGGSADIVLASGEHLGTLPFAEYQMRYPNLFWSLTAINPANGGVGSTDSHLRRQNDPTTWINADTRIMAGGAIGYDRLGAEGRNYLLLHEAAHTTLIGWRMNADCWDRHRAREPDAVYDQTSSLWIRNEKTANSIARVIARACGLPFLAAPTGGFLERQRMRRNSRLGSPDFPQSRRHRRWGLPTLDRYRIPRDTGMDTFDAGF